MRRSEGVVWSELYHFFTVVLLTLGGLYDNYRWSLVLCRPSWACRRDTGQTCTPSSDHKMMMSVHMLTQVTYGPLKGRFSR